MQTVDHPALEDNNAMISMAVLIEVFGVYESNRRCIRGGNVDLSDTYIGAGQPFLPVVGDRSTRLNGCCVTRVPRETVTLVNPDEPCRGATESHMR